ncbi:MAG TPA: FtsX-like permease family protein [Candidatus Angelobacter sp.]
MSRKRMLLRLMLKATWVRKDRVFTALLSIIVVATMATVALTVYSDLEGKFSREFRSFGANAIAIARHGTLSHGELQQIKTILGEKSEVVPLGYAVVTGESNTRIVVGGTDLHAFHQLNASWSFSTDRNDSIDKYSLWGTRAAQVTDRSTYGLHYGARSITISLGPVFKSGSEDDSRIYIDLQQFEQLTGLEPDNAQLRIDGGPTQVDSQIARLTASLPQIEVKPLLQIAATQTAVLSKTRSIVLAASAVVVVLIVVCMVATLTSAVLERRKDFAVMKALGASNSAVNLLFAGEAALTSMVGAILGFLVGSAIALWIGHANFGAAIPPRPDLLAPVVVGSILLALLASTAPLRVLRRIQPARILRGE